jgi:hypothetical protein
MILHANATASILDTNQYWLFTKFQLEDKPYATEYTPISRAGTIKDSSGNSLNANLTISNTPRWINNNCVISGCYNFNGSSSYIDLGNDPRFMPQSFSISMWFKFNATENSNWMVINKTATSGGMRGSYYIYGDTYEKARFSIFGPSNERYDVYSRTLEKERWYHIVGIYDNDNKKMKLYLDGELQEEASSSLGSNSANVYLGKYYDLSYLLDGFLDDVRIYNRVLSEKEIEALYNMKF